MRSMLAGTAPVTLTVEPGPADRCGDDLVAQLGDEVGRGLVLGSGRGDHRQEERPGGVRIVGHGRGHVGHAGGRGERGTQVLHRSGPVGTAGPRAPAPGTAVTSRGSVEARAEPVGQQLVGPAGGGCRRGSCPRRPRRAAARGPARPRPAARSCRRRATARACAGSCGSTGRRRSHERARRAAGAPRGAGAARRSSPAASPRPGGRRRRRARRRRSRPRAGRRRRTLR